jgi:hypothetical protein
MEEFGTLDTRVMNSDVEQSHFPFSKKSKFKKGVSAFFRNTQTNKDAMASSTISGGGLEAQRTPDLLFQLMFAIETQGSIVPNVAMKHPDGNGRDIYNPTEVMKAATSILDMCWTIRLKIVPNCTDELQKYRMS